MIEAAVVYKDFVDALSQLSNWSETTLNSITCQPPSEDLVNKFKDAFENISNNLRQESVKVESEISSNRSTTSQELNKLFTDSSFFQSDNVTSIYQNQVTTNEASQDLNQFQDRRAYHEINLEQENNVDRGLEFITNNESHLKTNHNFFTAAQDLLGVLSKKANDLNPADLLEAQRLVGILKVHAESGKKVSEGVSDTLEQLLNQQG